MAINRVTGSISHTGHLLGKANLPCGGFRMFDTKSTERLLSCIPQDLKNLGFSKLPKQKVVFGFRKWNGGVKGLKSFRKRRGLRF